MHGFGVYSCTKFLICAGLCGAVPAGEEAVRGRVVEGPGGHYGGHHQVTPTHYPTFLTAGYDLLR